MAMLVAAAIWLPLLHLFFAPRIDRYLDPTGLAPEARALANAHLRLWDDPARRQSVLDDMRKSNAEWDFMGRTFLVLSLANMAYREPAARDEYLAIIDAIVDDTIRLENEHGIYYFLMDYAQGSPFRAVPPRSIFQDGEIALMIAARRFVEEREDYKPLLAERVAHIRKSIEDGPVLCGESYPNECWMFCNAVALAVLRMSDALDGTDHSALIAQWIDTARKELTHPATGLLVSCFSYDGDASDGPEGSTIWMVAHCLQVVDPAFAEDQYRRAKKELAASFLGFGYAKEWPATWRGVMDVDSGPVIPFFDISAGSSGLAFLGAASFDDREYLAQLLASLHFGGFPEKRDGTLRYLASNQVGDAVLLYALVQGPLWRDVLARVGP